MERGDEVVQISDDDSSEEDAIIIRNGTISTTSLNPVETIVIDDESVLPNNVIEVNDSESTPNETEFSKFIEKCKKFDQSKGFIRAVQKNLMKAYTNADKQYVKSKDFEDAVTKASDLLDKDPSCKFNTIKNLCLALESHPRKKRANLYTLATNLKENKKMPLKRKGSTNITKGNKKAKIDAVIKIDDDQKDDTVINIDDDVEIVDSPPGQCSSIITDDLDEVQCLDEAEKENLKEKDEEPKLLEHEIEIEWDPTVANTSTKAIVIETPKILEPKPPDTAKLIQTIERRILYYKQRVMELEEQEVVDDSVNSPYILAEKYKIQIVKLYRQLCDLTGSQSTKRREVRLKVLNGHPSGPVERLERFINANIGKDGVPAFPDFSDVVRCVEEAAAEDENMAGWNKAKILQEASGLFTQCGQALQRQRQKREWRNLMTCVRTESVDYDPADHDPDLRAKLEANRRIAFKKENDLLEKYVIMQKNQSMYLNQGNQTGDGGDGACEIEINDQDDESENDTDSEENDEFDEVIYEPRKDNSSTVCKVKERAEHSAQSSKTFNDCSVQSGSQVNIQEETENAATVNTVNTVHQDTNQGDKLKESLIENNVDVNSERNVDNIVLQSSEEIDILDSVQSISKSNSNKEVCDSTVDGSGDIIVNIKKEPVDIAALLRELGENYTSSIVDIIDPFLVIEISSDSSDGESDSDSNNL